jgi:hypothetical protein
VKWILSLLIAGLLVGGFWWYRDWEVRASREKAAVELRERIQQDAGAGEMPSVALGDDFDPTVSTPRFLVLGADLSQVELEAMWPSSFALGRVSARVICPWWQTKVVSRSEPDIEQLKIGETVHQKIKEYLDGGKAVYLSGLCSSATCGEINRRCEISVVDN